MNETLDIHDFLIIKKVSLKIKKINVLIGRQANGKSLIAKLVYFFRRISTHLIEAIRNKCNKRQLDKNIIDDFENRFPRYAWEGTAFEIKYQLDEINIVIQGEKRTTGKTKLVVIYSDSLTTLFNSKKRAYVKRLEEYSLMENQYRRPTNYQYQAIYESVFEPIRQSEYKHFFSSSVFVPASRSFFANLQKNIFTFMASNLDIDPFLKDFGSLYEASKRRYRESPIPRKPQTLADSLDRSIESIIAGRYEYDDDQDWITTKGNRINLVNASSGQQEALPMLLTLAVWPFYKSGTDEDMFFIEEPEAHLFPTSQSRIISILTSLYDNLNLGFFITTHSPYILSALNNNILAGDVRKNKNITNDEYQNISGGGYPIDFDDIAAYAVSDGTAKSINDSEFRMIGAEVLDEVSEHFQEIMSNLLQRDEEQK